MSHADAMRFLDEVETDEAFAQQLESMGTDPEQALTVVRARGFDVDPAEIRDAFLERHGDDLSDEQLAALAGGVDLAAHLHDSGIRILPVLPFWPPRGMA